MQPLVGRQSVEGREGGAALGHALAGEGLLLGVDPEGGILKVGGGRLETGLVWTLRA